MEKKIIQLEKNFCECGCGQIPKGQKSKYCQGHHPNDTFSMLGRLGRIPWNKDKTHSEETRKKQSEVKKGEKHPNWKGGISKEPYCQEWDTWLKNQIKERDDYQCQNPECRKNISVLCIHHIDYDKKNCSTNNLITLCRGCNFRANYNREYWENILKKL